MTFWAHSGTQADQSDWQPLSEHLGAVADLAADMSRPLGLGRAARLAGLLHDLGKYDPAFQRRIRGEDLRVDHSTAGGAVLLDRAPPTQPGLRMAAELLAYAILGHHAGLPDQGSSPASLRDRVDRFDPARLDPAWKAELPVDLAGVGEEVFAKVRRDGGPLDDSVPARFDLSLAARMVFSCLVDADFKDTEAFYARIGQGPAPDRGWPQFQAILRDLLARFDAHIAGLGGWGELNVLRRDILAGVRGKAGMSPGLFTLTVPTGGGKTLASLGFALDHARTHGHSRIIYAIPFTSIIDQTAAVFRDVLGEGVVLEHHSALDDAGGGGEAKDADVDTGARKLRLAMEDWAAPVVVTTNVQLFESLFAARPSRARKLHNVANSVLVLDEAQAIPRPLLEPCVRMIDSLARHYGCTVVLCTATQPAFDRGRLALPIAGRELAPDPKGLASILRRARIERVGPLEDADLVAALRAEPQALVIVNSRAHALELFRAARLDELDGLVHLTTRQCAAHRRVVLGEVRRRLRADEPCRVVATSLVEAGVDLDFPRVWRAEAGLDQIVQAAGRCNREGRRALEGSVVSVFSTPGRKPPAEVADLVADMARMVDRFPDLLSPEAIEAYFAEVYWRLEDGLDAKRVLDRLTVSRAGTDFAFRSIADEFRLVESQMAPVVVPWDERARGELAKLHNEKVGSGAIARALQTYVVQVPPKAREALVRNRHARFERPDLRGNQFVVLGQGSKLYDADVGLEWERSDELPGGGQV